MSASTHPASSRMATTSRSTPMTITARPSCVAACIRQRGRRGRHCPDHLHAGRCRLLQGQLALNKVNVTFSKISADAKVTNGNSEYSYAGAEFDIYRTRDNALVAHITMDGSGRMPTTSSTRTRTIMPSRPRPQGFQKHEGRIDFSTGNSAGNSSSKTTLGM